MIPNPESQDTVDFQKSSNGHCESESSSHEANQNGYSNHRDYKPIHKSDSFCFCDPDNDVQTSQPDCDHHEVSKSIREACQGMVLSDDTLKEVMRRLLKAIKEGLSAKTHTKATVKCFQTYIQDFPTGKERGKFLGLDLGGTNFRVLMIALDEKNFDMQSKIYTVPAEIMSGPGEQLFDHIAHCLADFIKEHNLEGERLPLGFTFSFPCTQVGLTKGTLEQWTKGFNCSGVVGEDVVQLLQDALDRRRDTAVDTCAILNDTTGTLMSCAWKNPHTCMGVIVGTGFNACYIEKIENVELFNGDRSKPYTIINTEWGNFGANGSLDDLLTEYDREVDRDSINPGKQIMEKLIGGMYMGEIVRVMIVRFIKQKYLFGGVGSNEIMQKWAFLTKYVSEIEENEKTDYTNVSRILTSLGLGHATVQDYINVRYICEVVSRRAAYLVSASIATLLNKMNFERVTIGVDGSVYRFHPKFHDLMMEKIRQIADPKINFDIMLSKDGSGRGAALVAAVASRDKKYIVPPCKTQL